MACPTQPPLCCSVKSPRMASLSFGARGVDQQARASSGFSFYLGAFGDGVGHSWCNGEIIGTERGICALARLTLGRVGSLRTQCRRIAICPLPPPHRAANGDDGPHSPSDRHGRRIICPERYASPVRFADLCRRLACLVGSSTSQPNCKIRGQRDVNHWRPGQIFPLVWHGCRA